MRFFYQCVKFSIESLTERMIRNTKYLFLLAALLVANILPVKAQVQVVEHLDSLSILIGEQAHLTLTVNVPAGVSAELPTFKPSQNITPGVEVVEWSDMPETKTSDGMSQLKRVYVLTSFDEKVYAIPALKVKAGGKEYSGQPCAMKVLTVSVDTVHPEKFYPPKDVQDNPFKLSEWILPLCMSLLLLLCIAVLVFLIVRLRQGKPVIVRTQVVIKVPAHERALGEIQQIKKSHETSSADQKEYYTRLTDTLRKYIEQRFGFNAMEMTSSQIIEQLQSRGSDDMIAELRELFMTADLVKFAKYETLINENDRNLVNAVRFIDKTKTNEVTHPERVTPVLDADDKHRRQVRINTKIAVWCAAIVAVLIFAYVVWMLVDLLM